MPPVLTTTQLYSTEQLPTTASGSHENKQPTISISTVTVPRTPDAPTIITPTNMGSTATRMSTNSTQYPISLVFESLRAIMAMFNLQKLSTQMHLLATKCQETDDLIIKFVAVIDVVVDCFSTSK
jgi:pyruvate kinase